MNTLLFDKYRSAIESFTGDASAPGLLMAADGRLSVHYAPFEWVNPHARIVLVGITPGRTQAVNALNEAKRQIGLGASAEVAIRSAKATGAFSGAMRPNLVALLDYIGLSKWLGLSSCAELFGSASGLLQTASVLQYPVFVDGENYSNSPDICSTPLLRRLMLDHFAVMAASLPSAVFVPLGPVPAKAMQWLAAEGGLDARRVLTGLPHPSGANAERIQYFLGKKPAAMLSSKTSPEKLDAARCSLVSAVARL